MFSEVYWHHSVRSATAMLQRALFLLRSELDFAALFRLTDDAMIQALRTSAGDSPAAGLLDGLFGSHRRLYKRLAEYSYVQQRECYSLLARRPYPWLVRCAERFAALLSADLGEEVPRAAILFDAPPTEKEVEFRRDVFFPKESTYRRLESVSPVVRALAVDQFDDYVNRVRVLARADLVESLRRLPTISDRIAEAARQENGLAAP